MLTQSRKGSLWPDPRGHLHGGSPSHLRPFNGALNIHSPHLLDRDARICWPHHHDRATLARLLGSGASIALEGGILHNGKSGHIPASAVDAVETNPSWFWTRLTA